MTVMEITHVLNQSLVKCLAIMIFLSLFNFRHDLGSDLVVIDFFPIVQHIVFLHVSHYIVEALNISASGKIRNMRKVFICKQLKHRIAEACKRYQDR